MIDRQQRAIEELKRRGVETPYPSINKPSDSRRERAIQELKRRGAGSEEAGEKENSNKKPSRIGQFLHGSGSAYEGLGNLASKYIAAPMVKHASPNPRTHLQGFDFNELEEEETPEIRQRQEELKNQMVQRLESAPLQGLITNPIESAFGQKLTPEKGDTLGRVLHTAGEFGAILPGSGLVSAAKQGAKALTKQTAKELGAATGAAGALELTPHLTSEESPYRAVEDIAKAMIGGSYGRRLTGRSAEIANDIQKLASQGRFKETIKNIPAKAAGKVMSKFTKPNEEVLRKAAEQGIDLPINVGLGSTPLNWVANNYVKSVFTDRAWKDIIKKSDEQMIGKVNEAIDSLGSTHLKPAAASEDFISFLKNEEQSAKKEASKLYEDAASKLKPTDTVVPKNTLKALRGAKDILERDIQAPSTKKVTNILGQLAQKWGVTGKKDKIFAGGQEIDPSSLSKLLENTKDFNRPIEISRLDNIRKELLEILEYDPEVRGKNAFISRLSKEIEKDIQLSGNKEYLEARRAANKFFYKNLASRFRQDIGKSILDGSSPEYTFSRMNSTENIKELERVIGDSAKGKEVLNRLKQAKLREILEKATSSGGLEKGSLGTAMFSRIFNKGEKKQELLQSLLPNKKTYDDLADIAQIAEEFSKSGRELLNTSGSALVHADIKRVENVVNEGLKALTFHGGGALGGFSAAGVPGAILGLSGPWLASKLMANPSVVRETRAYALARQQGKEKLADTILNRIVKKAKPEAKNTLVEISKLNSEKEKRRSLPQVTIDKKGTSVNLGEEYEE